MGRKAKVGTFLFYLARKGWKIKFDMQSANHLMLPHHEGVSCYRVYDQDRKMPVLSGSNSKRTWDHRSKALGTNVSHCGYSNPQGYNMNEHLKAKHWVDVVNPKKAKSKKTPIFTIKVTCFACGGMAIGACWHHSIGDMHTFMCLMKAWSDTINHLEYEKPLITEDREHYSESRLEENHCADPGIRYLEGKEIIRFMFYMMFRARNKREIKFYFSEHELRNMCKAYSEKAGIRLSRNDSLCAHLFGIINNIDVFTPERLLSIAVEYRRRTNLPR